MKYKSRIEQRVDGKFRVIILSRVDDSSLWIPVHTEVIGGTDKDASDAAVEMLNIYRARVHPPVRIWEIE